MDRRIRQRQEEPIPSTSSAKGDYVPQSKAYYDDSVSSRIAKQAAEARSSVNQGHATNRRGLGKTQSLPANLFSASLDSSTQNTLRDAQDAIRLESQARNARELQPYAGVASPPRPDGRDPSNPFSNAPLRQDVFSGDLDWDNEFDIASSSPQAPAPFAGGFAPTLAASPTRPAPLKKRTHEHSKADNEEALDQLPELRDAMATDTTRQIRQPSRRLRPTASLPVETFGSAMDF